jgi:DNA-binding Lrp family transcriptional regulator
MKEKIIELRKRGLTINEIVAELNCAKSTVSYHINKIGLGGNNSDFLYGVDITIINKIKEFRLNNKKYSEIFREVDISEDKLKKICRKLDLHGCINNHKAKNLTLEIITKTYNETKSKKKTAKILGVSFETIKKRLGDYFLNKNIITKTQAVINWRKRKKQELVVYKGGKCERCGYDKSIEALQFHHIKPSEKDFSISGKSYSIERLKKEVDKCIMVCANCHIEIHEELRR